MIEAVRIGYKELFEREIIQLNDTIKLQHILELKYNGAEPNPYTENIKILKERLDYVKNKLDEIDD